MNDTRLTPIENRELIVSLVAKFAGTKDWAISPEGFFEIDGKESAFALGVTEEAELLKGQILPGGIRWYAIKSVREAYHYPSRL